MKKTTTIILSFILYLTANSQDIIINEVCSSGCGGFGDWIELYNTTSSDIDLAYYYLTDGDTTKWYFDPNVNTVISTVIEAGDYMLIYCNGDSRMASFDRKYRTNFKLSSDGESVRLFTPEKNLVSEITFPNSVSGESYGVLSDGTYSRFSSTTRASANKDILAYETDISLEAPVINAPSEVLNDLVPVSYTHLTLPTIA